MSKLRELKNKDHLFDSDPDNGMIYMSLISFLCGCIIVFSEDTKIFRMMSLLISIIPFVNYRLHTLDVWQIEMVLQDMKIIKRT